MPGLQWSWASTTPLGILLLAVFKGQSQSYGVFKEFCPGERQNWVQDAKCLEVFQVINNISDTADEHFDFPTVGENMCREQDCQQPACNRKEQERERKMRKFVTVECGLRLQAMGNGCVNKNTKVK